MIFNNRAVTFSANVVFSAMLFSFSVGGVAEAENFTDEKVFLCLKERARKSGIYKNLDPEYLFCLKEENIENKPLSDLVDMYVYLEERILNSRTNVSDVPMYSTFLPSYLSKKDDSNDLGLPKSEIIPKVDVNSPNAVSKKLYKKNFTRSETLKENVKSPEVDVLNPGKLSAKNSTKADADSFRSEILKSCEECLSKICYSDEHDESFKRNSKDLQVKDPTKVNRKLSYVVSKVYKEYPAKTAFRLISKKLNSCGAKLFKDYICENSLSDILDVFALEKIKSSDFESKDEFFKRLFQEASKLSENLKTCSDYLEKQFTLQSYSKTDITFGKLRTLEKSGCFKKHFTPSSKGKTDIAFEKMEILEKIAEVFFKVYYILAENRETNIAFFYESFSFLIDNSVYVLELQEVSKKFLERFAKDLLDALLLYGNLFKERVEAQAHRASYVVRKELVRAVLDSVCHFKKSVNIIEDMKKVLLKWSDEHENEKSIFSEKVSTIEYELKEMEKAGEFKTTFLGSK